MPTHSFVKHKHVWQQHNVGEGNVIAPRFELMSRFKYTDDKPSYVIQKYLNLIEYF